jgi:dihydrofolate reductase
MVIFGSGGLVSALAPHGLIDEYRMIMNPAILGQGIPMFRGFSGRIGLTLLGSRIFDGSTVMLSYRPAAS